MSYVESYLTIGLFLQHLSPEIWDKQQQGPTPPVWPPDVFAIATAILQRSGAYPRVVRPPWPPTGTGLRAGLGYREGIRAVGSEWRKAAGSRSGKVPDEVRAWWETLIDSQSRPVHELGQVQGLPEALLHLCAAADEASWGAGLLWGPDEPEAREFLNKAFRLLQRRQILGVMSPSTPGGGATLCQHIPSSRLRVLPKLRTPQRGISIRSLSHNLALCTADDVDPVWSAAYLRLVDEEPETEAPERIALNLLVIPWPEQVFPTHFNPGPSPEASGAERLPFGAFTYRRRPDTDRIETIVGRAIERAEFTVGKIHAVILPELALLPEEYKRIAPLIIQKGLMLISGILSDPEEGRMETNEAIIQSPMLNISGMGIGPVRQRKRHRWCLDRSQIVQYGLGSQLDPTKSWWEQINVDGRELNFVSIRPWLSLCVLICEDLARQDPVAEVVRSVGPNLVIALLMDGPQMKERWPARCATVLADDPGSSVLTVTSLGMAQLSRPSYSPEPRRTIALWKDADSPPTEINLPKDAQAVVLCLTGAYTQELTADRRFEGNRTVQLTLSGNHPISIGTVAVSTDTPPNDSRSTAAPVSPCHTPKEEDPSPRPEISHRGEERESMMIDITPKESTILTFLAGYTGSSDVETDQEIQGMLDNLTTPVAKDIGLYLLGRKPLDKLKKDVAEMAKAFQKSIQDIQKGSR